MNLLRLGAVLDSAGAGARGDGASHRARAERTIAAFRGQWTRTPHAMPQMLCALELLLMPPAHVVLAGNPSAADFRALHRVVHEGLGARRVVLAVEGAAAQQWLATRAPWLASMAPQNGRATAYVCESFSCQAPVDTPEALKALLDG
jgi:uncharacterized protein YyaL (SSP411 family)